jgi:hypothetical protein
MKTPQALAALPLITLLPAAHAIAQAVAPSGPAEATYSSSNAPAAERDSAPGPASFPAAEDALANRLVDAVYRPFHAYALGFRIGDGGIGGEIATPLTQHLVLRGGAQAFTYSTTFTTNGLNADGTLKLGDGFISVDFFPFRSGFHLSPGITVHNGNNVAAHLGVPPGATFTLNNVDYTSEASDPITGDASLKFGNKVAPRLTVGFGNLFSRSGGHFSFPAEIGFEYISTPTVALNLSGSACSSDGCGSINSPENQANIAAQQQILANDIAPLRFFPILSFGVAYRFGH